nr:host-nuclease inhibitor Gam family protein [Clostridium sp. Cult2]
MELEIEEAIDTAEAADVGGRFIIDDLDSANWAFRKLAAIEKKKSEIQELANKEIERIREWQQQEEKGLNNSKGFFEGLLIKYFSKEREKDSKFKLSTPYGKITTRKQQPKWNYEDEKIIESLKSRGISHLVKTEIIEKVNKNELKDSVEVLDDVVVLDGNIVPNIKLFGENFINIETGEIVDAEIEYKHYERVIAYNGQVIEGISVEDRPDSVNIKVEV